MGEVERRHVGKDEYKKQQERIRERNMDVCAGGVFSTSHYDEITRIVDSYDIDEDFSGGV